MKSNNTEEKDEKLFDPEEFKAEITKMIQGMGKDVKKNLAKEIANAVKAATAGALGENSTESETELETTSDGTDKPKGGNKPEENAAVRELRRVKADIDSLKKERDNERNARLESEKRSTIQEVIGRIRFRDDAAQRLFRKSIEGDIVRDDDGKLVARVDNGQGGTEDLPIDSYIQDQAALLPGLLAAEGRGGSGATGGKNQAGSAINLEDIKPGMGKDALNNVLKQAVSLLPPRN